jgi:hypothetical protein
MDVCIEGGVRVFIGFRLPLVYLRNGKEIPAAPLRRTRSVTVRPPSPGEACHGKNSLCLDAEGIQPDGGCDAI